MQIRIAVIALVGAVIVAGWLGLSSSHTDRADAPIRIAPRVLAAQGFPGFPGQGFGGANREQALVPEYEPNNDEFRRALSEGADPAHPAGLRS